MLLIIVGDELPRQQIAPPKVDPFLHIVLLEMNGEDPFWHTIPPPSVSAPFLAIVLLLMVGDER